MLCRARARVAGFTFLDWLQLFLPCVKWLRTYKVKEYLLVSAADASSNASAAATSYTATVLLGI